jgi:hypothetical protein
MGKSSSGGGTGFRGFVQFFVLPLLLVDGYAAWRLSQASEKWHIRLLPGDIPGSLGALITVLALNAVVIVVLLLVVGGGKR